MAIVEDRLGYSAGSIVSNLLLSGHAQKGDLAQVYTGIHSQEDQSYSSSPASFPNGRVLNGHSKDPPAHSKPTLDSFRLALQALLENGFLSTVRQSYFRSDADNTNEAEMLVRRQIHFQGELKGEKKVQFALAVEQQLQDWRLGSIVDGEATLARVLENQGTSKKRKYQDDIPDLNPISRKARSDTKNTIADASTFQVEHSPSSYQGKQPTLRINYDKLAVVARSRKLAELVEQRIGRTTSLVYTELLKGLEKKVEYCEPHVDTNDDFNEEEDIEVGPKVSAAEISTGMVSSGEFGGAIGHAEPSKINLDTITHRKWKRRKIENDDEAEVNGNASSDEDEDTSVGQNGHFSDTETHQVEINGESENESKLKVEIEGDEKTDQQLMLSSLSNPQTREHHIRQNLFLLAEHPYEFVTHIRRRHNTPESWTVNFRKLSSRLRMIELEKMVKFRYGVEGLRIVRILQEKGKLDEKAIASFALMNQKIMRSILTTMHEAGHLELQEVPRDNQRQPSRTMFLWFFDPERCRRKVLEETFKTMARCLQRAKTERGAIQSTIDKASRTDVVGKEDEFLDVSERTALEQWREKEERLLGELGRLDDLVAVLRDF